MIELMIPGRGKVELLWMVLDFNGTIAFDGEILPGVVPLLHEIAKELEIFVLTADTFGTAKAQCAGLPVLVRCLESDEHALEKAEFIAQMGNEHVVAIGNGRNDLRMLKLAAIGIGVMGEEGCAGEVWTAADVVVPRIESALELVLHPKRLIATLRG